MLERRLNPVGRVATAGIPRITLGGLRLAVLDIEQTANFMIEMAFPHRRLGRPLYLTSANGQPHQRGRPAAGCGFAPEIDDAAAGARRDNRSV